MRFPSGMKLGFVFFGFVHPTVGAAQVVSNLVAISGDRAPGTDDTFLRFSNPVINAMGEVAFQANLAGPTTDVVPHGIWVGSHKSLRPLAVAGDVAPETQSARFHNVGWPIALTTDGQALFYGDLVMEHPVTFENRHGIWAGQPDGVELVARRQNPAPDLPPPDLNYSSLHATPHSSGTLALSATLQGPGVDPSNASAVWTGSIAQTDELQLIARAGDPAPGLAAGWRFGSVSASAINAAGVVALFGTAAPESSTTPQPGIWLGPPSDMRLVTLADFAAPGVPHRRFSSFTGPRLNNAGQIAFRATLDFDSDEQPIDNGIWAGSLADGISPVALEGQTAPGFDDPTAVWSGSELGDLVSYDPFANPVLGGGGHVAFAGTVVADTVDFDHNDGIWVSDPLEGAGPPSLHLAAREGDHPPGTAEGTRFEGIFYFDDLIPAFSSPLLNSAGQVAFEATTKGPLNEIGTGIWATDAVGTLQHVAHSGDRLTVGRGDVREIALLKLNSSSSSQEGYLSGMNAAGQLTFAVSFTDGSEAVLVATVFGTGDAGDFNVDGALDALDVNELTTQSASRLNSSHYDLNADMIVDTLDVAVWIRDLFGSWIGDADLDKEFGSADLAAVLAAGTYEADAAAVWSTGDFDGNGHFNSADLIAAIADGGYEQGPRAAAARVPEPLGGIIWPLGTLFWMLHRRTKGGPPRRIIAALAIPGAARWPGFVRGLIRARGWRTRQANSGVISTLADCSAAEAIAVWNARMFAGKFHFTGTPRISANRSRSR